MTERPGDERVFARWKIDAADLREFVREQRIRAKNNYFPAGLLKECEAGAQGAGIEVVFREDAIFVGTCRISNMFDEFRVHDTWMQCLGDEGYQIAVPIARGGKPEAERIAATYRAHNEQVRSRAAQEYAAERARPTVNNRLLRFSETQFVWISLGFFFVVIPLLVLAMQVVFGEP